MYPVQEYKRESTFKKRVMNLFKALIQSGRRFCMETSINGFNHIAANNRHWTERLLWVFVTGTAIWGAIGISLGQLQRFNENPIVVTLEKDFRSWRFSLPAVTTCSNYRVNEEKLPGVINKLWKVGPDNEKYAYYKRFVEVVANSDLYHLEKYQEFKDDEELNVDLYRLVVDVMQEQEVKATWSDGVNPKWLPVMTEGGICYVTNSLAIADVVINKIYANDTKDFPITCKYSAMSCFVTLEVTTTAHFYIHSPYDVADMTSPPSTVYPKLNRISELSVIETMSGNGIRNLSPKRRRCLYTNEPINERTQVYSTNICMMSCRVRLAIKLCGCKPFYYFYEGGPTCTPSGMWCLASHAQQLDSTRGIDCVCNQQCIDSVFREIISEDQLWESTLIMIRGSVRFQVQAPRTRYTREIVFHFQDLVVSFGGAAGLFLGASFISFVEILYFIIERILRVFIRCDEKKENQIKPKTISFEELNIVQLTRILQDQAKYEQRLSSDRFNK